VAFESAVSSKTSIEQLSFRKWKKSVKTWEIYMYIIFLYQIFQKTVSNELSKTDDYQLTKCFHSLIRWNIAM
jgi:hypothetical protein